MGDAVAYVVVLNITLDIRKNKHDTKKLVSNIKYFSTYLSYLFKINKSIELTDKYHESKIVMILVCKCY